MNLEAKVLDDLRPSICYPFLNETEEALKELVKKNIRVRKSDKQKMAEWAFKVYFKVENKNKNWFDSSIAPNNILEYIKKTPKFPITYSKLVKLWKVYCSLQINKNMKKPVYELDYEHESDVIGKKEAQGIDESMDEIARTLGNFSPAGIKKTIQLAMHKIKLLTNNKSWNKVTSEKFNEINETIDKARVLSAIEYAITLKEHQLDILKFLEYHVEHKNILRKDLELITTEEMEHLITLSSLTIEEIQHLLLLDIENVNNVFTTFQNLVSKNMFLILSGKYTKNFHQLEEK